MECSLTVNWDNYSPYVPPHRGPLEDMPRAQARESFHHLLDSLGDRRGELLKLLGDNGVDVDLSTKIGLSAADNWYRSSVERSETDPRRMRNVWYSVSNDIGLVLGDVFLARHPTLSWHFYTGGRKDISYHKAVIIGFTVPKNKKYNFNPIGGVVTYGTRLAQGLSTDPLFVEMLDRQATLV